jgi:cell division cycle 2-like protein
MVAERSVAPVGCVTDDEVTSSGTIMDAARVAGICAKIEEYAAGGAPMSSRRVAAICAMLDDRAAAGRNRRNKRRKMLCVDSTRSYKQIGEIGSGSFGAVVKACHRRTGQTVAMKTFRRRDGKKAPAVSQILREACFLAACGGHPNLAGLHAVARDPRTKRYSLVMEYVGPSLRRALKDHQRVHGGPFPEAEARRVMAQLLAGAEAMHAHRIIHRDIKLGNVLVSEDGGVVKICDYGLAMSTAKAGPPYARVGTAPYMAPEVLTRRTDYDERVDLWSLGCVMAEMLSGEVLFKVDDEEDYMHQLDRMFDALGAPYVDTLQTFAPPFAVGKLLRRLARQPRSSHQGRLREMFPRETLSQDGFDVLKGLLTLNPKERLTAAAALRLPWFTAAVDAPASEIGGMPSSTFVRVLTSALAFLRRMALELIKLPRRLLRYNAS